MLILISTGAPVTPEGISLGYLPPFTFVVDVIAGTAVVPSTGDEPVLMTEVHDVARGVAHACLYDGPWVRETGYMVGERTTYNNVIRTLEEVTGTYRIFINVSDHYLI
jgi:hypothetical protein